jgi:hypothetical protein
MKLRISSLPWILIQFVCVFFFGKCQSQIHNACQNAGELDMNQVYAVQARMELDLRIGAALTRCQTMGLQTRFHQLADSLISYGLPFLILHVFFFRV